MGTTNHHRTKASLKDQDGPARTRDCKSRLVGENCKNSSPRENTESNDGSDQTNADIWSAVPQLVIILTDNARIKGAKIKSKYSTKEEIMKDEAEIQDFEIHIVRAQVPPSREETERQNYLQRLLNNPLGESLEPALS
ncbi:hypothetical protein TNCV_122051 [Trichonephila clavipes]|nr:hypothetical protein TNCV_122051 [Trichonephila clavipes]